MMLSHTQTTTGIQLPALGPTTAVRPRMVHDQAVRPGTQTPNHRRCGPDRALPKWAWRPRRYAASPLPPAAPTGTVYPYFRNKEELYAAVLSDGLTNLHEHLATASGSATDPRERVEITLRSYCAYYRSRPNELSFGL